MIMASRRSGDTSPSVPRSLALEKAPVGRFPDKSVFAVLEIRLWLKSYSSLPASGVEDRQLGECRVGATLFLLPHPINILQANKWKLLKFIDAANSFE